MRRVSNRRQKLLSEVGPWRQAFKKKIGRCEKCLKPAKPEQLDCHEVVTGNVRAKALDKKYAVMCVHRYCHNELEQLTIPHQLGYFIRARAEDCDLEALWRLMGRRWPDMEHILYFLEKL